jgi:hypothetical protein
MTKQEDQERETLKEVRKAVPKIEAANPGIRVFVGYGPGEAPPPGGSTGWAADPHAAEVQAEQNRHQALVAEAMADLNRRRREAGEKEAAARAKAAKEEAKP